jgi:hypothetical protein
MKKQLVAIVLTAASVGCGGSPAEGSGSRAVDVAAFVGTWRSVTPSFEFIGLSVVSTSSRQGVLAARVTLSGVRFDASGQPDADSLVAPMTVVGGGQAAGTLAVRAADDHTLSVQLRPVSGAPQNLTFVRE